MNAQRSSGWGGRLAPYTTAMLHLDRLRVASAMQLDIDAFEYGWQLVVDVGIPEAEDTIAFCFEPPLAPQVAASLIVFVVMTAVEFDDEVCGRTKEIDDVRTDRSLASEMRALQRKLFQRTPQDTLMRRRIAAESLCGCATER